MVGFWCVKLAPYLSADDGGTNAAGLAFLPANILGAVSFMHLVHQMEINVR